MVVIIFFLFKRKTAYEMRISDWSSACALPIYGVDEADHAGRDVAGDQRRGKDGGGAHFATEVRRSVGREGHGEAMRVARLRPRADRASGAGAGSWRAAMLPRSEEHTSELQSLMRISYAVFC